MPVIISPGTPERLGPYWNGSSLHLAVVAPAAHSLELHLFRWGDPEPFFSHSLDPQEHRMGGVWHCSFVPPELPLEYAFTLNGKKRWIGDPYATCLGSRRVWRHPGGRHESFARGVVSKPAEFSWEGTQPPHYCRSDLIIYEAHVRGFTMDDQRNSAPGTFLGMVERLDHLVELGVTALELLPIVEFDELAYRAKNPHTGEELCQFWGYSPVSFFAPMRRYCKNGQDPDAPTEELKTLVRECHRRKIAVILDLVYNHTALPNDTWAKLAPRRYYTHCQGGRHTNYSGCGNTVAANHVLTRHMIQQSLRHLAAEYRIDGFRFDLAACLWRANDGSMLHNPPVIEAITQDPLLSNCYLIAEPWDAGGAYQVGGSYSPRWMQWNGACRDTFRRFLKGDPHQAGSFAGRLCGSQDLFGGEGAPAEASPLQSLNFITCHDGFSLHDWASYNDKHNEENGEHNLDGCNHNDSWNCGAEGPTDSPEVLALRQRQIVRGLLAVLISQGVPMLLMGDEVALTRGGNNNVWCQDNYRNALPWDAVEQNAFPLKELQQLIALRKELPQLRSSHFLTAEQVQFHGIQPGHPDWSEHTPLVLLSLPGERATLLAGFSRAPVPLDLELPEPPAGTSWEPLLHTDLPLPPYGYGLWLARHPL